MSVPSDSLLPQMAHTRCPNTGMPESNSVRRAFWRTWTVRDRQTPSQ